MEFNVLSLILSARQHCSHCHCDSCSTKEVLSLLYILLLHLIGLSLHLLQWQINVPLSFA